MACNPSCREHNDPQWQAAYLATDLPTGHLILAEDDVIVGDGVLRWLPRELVKLGRCLVREPDGYRVESLTQTWLDGREPWFPRARPEDAIR